MFSTGLIDSLKLRILKDKITIVDERLISSYVKYYTTLDMIDEEVNDSEPLTIIINGITYRYYFKSYPNKRGFSEEYLVLQISAKMVKEDYFSGITKKNVKNIIRDINEQKIVYVSEAVFLDGLVSDIDICVNQLIDIESYDNALKLLKNNPKASCEPLLHYIRKTNSQGKILNLGLDFNKREKATNARPYCKIYHKGFELQTKSVEFYNCYLAPMRSSFLDNCVRYEFTIKAYKHKEYLTKLGLLKIDLKTLKDLLSIKPKDLLIIAQSGIENYVHKPKPKKNLNTGNINDDLISFLMQELFYCGKTLDDIKNFLHTVENKDKKSIAKRKINNLYDKLIFGNSSLLNRLETNEKTNKFLGLLGL